MSEAGGTVVLDQAEILEGQYEDCQDAKRGCVSAGMGVALRADGSGNAFGLAGVEGPGAEDRRVPAAHRRCRHSLKAEGKIEEVKERVRKGNRDWIVIYYRVKV